ncbi:MAG: UDP-N-acetylmuramate--L-alanine ligase [Lachnospiraceae bacterium]|nr:UDP-N-acetylmuramate--L-alanine ligase [Lachnospiraceae bacterium]
MYKVDFNKTGKVYFIGIGGSSMSGLAEIMMKKGYSVSGSDMAESYATEKLEEMGIAVHVPQEAKNISADTDFIVYTAAIAETNPEYVRALELGIPMIERAPFLGQLMENYSYTIGVSGTHGKTTTSSMMSAILSSAGIDISASLGGVCDEIGGNSKYGTSEYFVAESCEYKRSFLSFNPNYEIVTNIEAEHLDYYKDIEDIRSAFREFLEKPKENGIIVINGDIDKLDSLTDGLKAKVFTYGADENVNLSASDTSINDTELKLSDTSKYDYFAKNITFDELGRGEFDLCKNEAGKAIVIMHIKLGVLGIHNVLNSTAAAALALEMGISADAIKTALVKFKGAHRRFEVKGKVKGVLTIVDDYAHHPSEIKATLLAAKHFPHNTLYTVFQPHTYSRLKKLLPDFANALLLSEKVILTDIYAAREKNPGDISSLDLLDAMKKDYVKAGHSEKEAEEKVIYISDFGEIEDYLLTNAKEGDVAIMMGAGTVINIGNELLGL